MTRSLYDPASRSLTANPPAVSVVTAGIDGAVPEPTLTIFVTVTRAPAIGCSLSTRVTTPSILAVGDCTGDAGNTACKRSAIHAATSFIGKPCSNDRCEILH